MLLTRKMGTVWPLLLASLLAACADDGDGDGGTCIDTNRVEPAPVPPPPPAPYDDVVELVVRNQTSRVVYRLYVSPSTSESWGPDLLGNGVLGIGQSRTFQTEYCDAYYDLKAVDLIDNTIVRADRLFFRCGVRETVNLR